MAKFGAFNPNPTIFSQICSTIRGVRQRNPYQQNYSQQQYKNSNLEIRYIDIGGERLTDLRFADDVALTTNTVEDMEQQLNILNEKSKRVGLKIHRGKTKFMTNFATTQTKFK